MHTYLRSVDRPPAASEVGDVPPLRSDYAFQSATAVSRTSRIFRNIDYCVRTMGIRENSTSIHLENKRKSSQRMSGLEKHVPVVDLRRQGRNSRSFNLFEQRRETG